jgi:hypothetical protein
MKSVTVELRLTVKYELDDGQPLDTSHIEQAKSYLDELPKFAANRGLLSGESELIVDDWRHEVKVVG